MDKYEAFEKLREYSKDLSNHTYEEIYELLKSGIKAIPIPLAKIHKAAFIDRVRQNDGTQLFKHINDLGYIKDQDVIDKILTSFGRANCPHQVMFYGALESYLIDKPRLTAIAETSTLFRNPKLNSHSGDLFTVSRWETSNEFLAVEIVFSKYALANNEAVKKSYERQIKMLEEHGLEQKEIDFHLDFLKFISEEFSKKVTNHEDYKISAAYTNIVMLHPDVQGIVYPSVQTDYFGINIVVPPETVDRLINPKITSTLTLYKNGLKSLITNGKYVCKNINPKKDLDWQETGHKQLSEEEIKDHLDL
ncbi:hypothetical protein JM79_2108 [Gramella sp. Hel_I_59]|uniref:hypothetical protein n=1 Tax=Gramella sp. Hel_I_59 TaxID=1249978 RepID=UPI00114E42B5|nr:hypothetical protein [Gramella sp. Hel_I_59]TQI71181.1 hypothetical protein JM79_2108 [Gramella sp. Hel_I_59]